MHMYLRILTYMCAYNTHTYRWTKNKVETMYVEKQDKQMKEEKSSLMGSL